MPLLAYHRPGDPAVAQRVAERIAAYAARGIRLRAVMLSRLGPHVWHDDPASAAAVLEKLEETARLALLAGDRSCRSMPDRCSTARCLRRAGGRRCCSAKDSSDWPLPFSFGGGLTAVAETSRSTSRGPDVRCTFEPAPQQSSGRGHPLTGG